MGSLFDEARLALHQVWTRRWLALGVAWGVCVLGWLVVSWIPSQYESRARVFVQMQQLLPTTMADGAAPQREIDRIRQTMVSAVNLEKVVRGTDLADMVASEQDVADRIAGLAQNIKVTAQQDNLFEITTAQPSPKLARAVTAKLIDSFVEQTVAGDRSQTQTSLRFLDAQLAQRQKQLAEAEAKRAAFQNSYLGVLPGAGSVADRIGAARAQMAQVDGDLAAAGSALAAVQGQMAGTPRTIPGSGLTGGLGPARARLAAVQSQLADARARGFTEAHPDVVALKGQLTAAQAGARGEPLGGVAGAPLNPLHLSLQSMVAEKQAAAAALRIRRAQLQGDLDQLNAKLATDPDAAAEQGRIERDYQVLKTQYDELLTQREQVALRGEAAAETSQVKFSVIDPPTTPQTPAAPNRLLLLSGVLVAGLTAGVGAAFALGQLRQTFATTPRLARASGMPVLGHIGEMVTRAQAEARAKRLKQFAGGVAALGAAYVLLLGVELLQRGLAV